MSLFDMTGKTAIITGSSRGIGQAIAEEMAAHGAKVAISSRNIEDCEKVAAGINAKHTGRSNCGCLQPVRPRTDLLKS